MLPSDAVGEAIATWFPQVGHVRAVRPVGEGPGLAWWSVEASEGRFLARTMDGRHEVRALPFEVFAVRHLAERTPLVPEALLTKDGRSYGEIGGMAMLLFAAGEGEPSRPGVEGARAAGQALAAVHVAGLDFGPPPRPSFPSWESLDWELNEPWTWADLERASRRIAASGAAGRELAAALPFLRQARDEVSAWLEAARDAGPAFGLVHGGLAPGALLVRDGHPTAVHDWHRCRGDWLVADLAIAAWEFARRPGSSAPDPALATELTEAYLEAGGPMPLDDLRWLSGMVRAELLRRLCELAFVDPDALVGPAQELIRGIEAVDAAVPLVIPKPRPGGPP
ncbi:Homoserine kinase [bacterium HR29]|jgi:Ser/Thr protein kinase RdoA (MazF antagonist)|nr:Homoserine kinase [bacterium HR29]